MALVEFQNVVKKFGGVAVLDGVTFGVEKGEVLCIVGPSGTGKSVTLKHLVRLLTPTSGKVLIDGIDVAECDERTLAAIRRRVGYLFQGGALLAWMTVAENVALPLRECTDLPDAEIDARVAKALESVELAAAAEKYPGEISGGMQKRAGLARAIVRDSDIILYDVFDNVHRRDARPPERAGLRRQDAPFERRARLVLRNARRVRAFGRPRRPGISRCNERGLL